MRVDRIIKLRALAEAHKANCPRSRIILECLNEIEILEGEKERLKVACGCSIDAALARFPKCAFALKRLKTLVGA
jgi:hypothetical protein